MGLFLGCMFYLFTAGITIAILTIATVFLAIAISWMFNLPFYGPYEAMGDMQWLLIILLIHDRYVGPYSKLLRGVAKYLPGRKTVDESYEHDR